MLWNSPINRALLRRRKDLGEKAPHPLDRQVFFKYLLTKEAYQPIKNFLSGMGWLLGICLGFVLVDIWAEILSLQSITLSIMLYAVVSLLLGLVMAALLGSLGLFWSATMSELVSELNYYKENSEIDHLSGLKNRRGFEERLFAFIAGYRRGVIRDMAILFLDIDHFKSINDKWGHAFGDEVIKAIAEFIERKHRGNDFSARWGGEEFVILAMGIDLPETIRMAERIRSGIADLQLFFGDQRVPVSVSIGVTALRPEDSKESFIERADTMLYQAKEDGRNCVKWSS